MAYVLCKSSRQNWYPGLVMKDLVPVTLAVVFFNPCWTWYPLGIDVA